MKQTTTLLPFILALSGGACGSVAAPELTAEPARDISAAHAELTATPLDLIAIGVLDGHGFDKSPDTAGALENGQPGNMLGGIGSGLAYAGGHTFLALPDRGPNATPYNPLVDNTTSFINRFQRVKLQLKKHKGAGGLPFDLIPTLQRTTLLSAPEALVYGTGQALNIGDGTPALNDEHHHYFVGRSDAFDPAFSSTHASDGRLDPEGIRVANDGEHVFISDEYGPYVYVFNRNSGSRERTFELPAEFAVTHLSAQGDVEISGNSSGRVANKGMEGLAITPDGRTLVGAMQSPLAQDGGTSGRFLRIVTIALDTGAMSQFAYELTNIDTAAKPKYPTVSEIVAVNDHEFLVDERDGKGLGDNSSAAFKRIFHIDIADAVDVSGLSGEGSLMGKAVPKTLLLDVVTTLNAHGFASTEIPAKLEGLAFGPDVTIDGKTLHTLFLANDNDFLPTIIDSTHPMGIENPNRWFVFGIDPAALPGFTPQAFDGEDDDE